MSGTEIDDYLDALEEPKRTTLARLREIIMAIVPEAEECISYGMPAFKLRGKTIAGFAAFKNHLSYLPHSGSVIPQLAKETERDTSTKGSLHFPVDKPLPETLVKNLLAVRMAEAFGTDNTGSNPVGTTRKPAGQETCRASGAGPVVLVRIRPAADRPTTRIAALG